MKPRSTPAWALPLGVLLAVPSAMAGLDEWGEQANRIGLNLRSLFNVEATFRNLGGFPAATAPGPAASGIDHVYDDGYNRVDSGGNGGGATWNWGYDRATQVVGGTNLVLSSTAAMAAGQFDSVTEDPHWGGELTFAHELGWNGSYWWGIQAGLSWTEVKIGKSGRFTSAAQRTSDTYALLGSVPTAPHRGEFDTAGPLLGDTPTRKLTTLPDAASTTGDYEVDGAIYGLRVGLLFETPITKGLDLQFGGGVAAGWVRADFTFSESTVITDVGRVSLEGSSSDSAFIYGAYVEVGVALRLTRRLTAQAGVQYTYFSDYSQETLGHEVELDLSKSVAATAGLNFAF